LEKKALLNKIFLLSLWITRRRSVRYSTIFIAQMELQIDVGALLATAFAVIGASVPFNTLKDGD
jgi:hypothetical protein